MKKICICVLVLFMACSKVFASVPVFDTASPINLTVRVDRAMAGMQEQFNKAMHHFAVAIHEATNGAHQLGNIRVIQGRPSDHRENLHINLLHRNSIFLRRAPANTRIAGSHIPFSQTDRRGYGGIEICCHAFDGITTGGIFRPGPIDVGYTLAHEAGHFIYGLFDEYTASLWPNDLFRALWSSKVGPWDGLARDMNSIMGTQRRAVIGNECGASCTRGCVGVCYFRALALNFSTRYHYDSNNPRYRTAQRRMYPWTVSGWNTLESSAPPRDSSHFRSQFLDLRDVHPDWHPNRDPNMPEMVITHRNGLPGPNTTLNDFARLRNEGSRAFEHLNIRWGSTDRQRARLFLIGGSFTEMLDLRDRGIPQEELENFRPHDFPWNYSGQLLERIQVYIEKMPEGSYVAFAAFNSNRGLHSIVDFRRVTGTSIDLSHVKQAISGFEDSSGNIPVYDRLYDAIVKLDNHMISNGIILGDIVVLLGTQTPDVSEARSTISSRTARTLGSKDALIEKSRNHFIPITFEGFNINATDMHAYSELARLTGGMAGRAVVPTNPELLEIINGALWRRFMISPDPSLGPWDGYMSYIIQNITGNFMGSGSNARSFGNFESSIAWLPSAPYAKEPFYQSILPSEIRPVSFSTSFYVDSFFKSFLAQIVVRNPHQHALEVVLIDPSGTEHPVSLNWVDDRRNGSAIARLNLEDSNTGRWRIVCRGASSNEAQIWCTVVGISRGLFELEEEWEIDRSLRGTSTARPYKGAIFSRINVVNVGGGTFDRANGGDLFVTLTTHEGRYPLTNLSVNVSAQLPDGRTVGVPMSDGGIWPDAVASDGIFTGVLRVGHLPEGQIILTANVSNPSGTATPTYFMNNAKHIEDFDLDGESPFFGEPIIERFYRRTQKAFDVIGTVPVDAPSLPDFETVTLPLMNVGQISGLTYLLPGIEIELNVGIYPEEATEFLAEHLSWSMPLSRHPNLTISPDPEGRPNVVRVLFHETGYGSSEWLQFDSTTPRALRGLMESQTRTHRLILSQPLFIGAGFNNRTMEITVLEGEEAFYNIWLSLPPGYDDSASWSMTANPDNAGEIVSQRADGVTFRTLRPGRFTMTLTSDVWPQLINRSVEVHSVFREMPGTQPGRPGDDAFGPNPIPGRPDPGGDDDVRTRPDTGNDGGNGGGPSRDPEYQDPQDPVLLPPELSRITLGGRDITDDGVRLIRQWEIVPLVLEFRESIDRYMLSAAFMAGTNPPHDATSATSTIDNIALSEDGKTLSYEFMGKVPGQHRVFFNVERKDGIEAAGSFVLHVQPSPNLGGQGGPEEGEQGNEGSGGGGCNAGAGALATMLVLAATAWKIRKS